MSSYDVVVIGAGPAGLSGALMLGRSRRAVLVIDAGEPRNAPAEGVHRFLSRDGVPPRELLRIGRDEVAHYGGELRDGAAVAVERELDGFAVSLSDGARVHGRRLLVTTGLVDELPDVPGVRERWGRDVIHCPYCHGYEVRDQPIGVLSDGPIGVHQAQLFRQLSDDVVLFTNGGAPAETELLAARGIRIVTDPVERLVVEDDRLTGVRLAGGEVVARSAVVAGPRFVARSALLESLGLETVADERGIGVGVPADPTGRTDVPGVWVAGNVTDLTAQVVASAAGGVMAGAAINADLIAEETAIAVAAYRRAS